MFYIKWFMGIPFYEKLNWVRKVYFRVKTRFFYRYIFGSMGARCEIRTPVDIYNANYMHLGDRVYIGAGARLGAIRSNPTRTPELRIGNYVNIEQNVHIICHSRIHIADNVTITGHCAIVDTTHPYEDVHDPRRIGERILDEDSYVEIGEGSFLGFGAVVLPNVRIGKHCIIGANACVTKDVPDFSVAAGNPARIIRVYDEVTDTWVRKLANRPERI
jgi:acetyltransferase-like isoleucine patch superfamily enzyme